MKNPVLKKIVLGILVLSFVGVFFVMSIMDLTNKKDLHEVKISYAVELLVVENSINGLIPTGKDYYYLGFSEETEKMYAIHASKNWLKKNFDSEGICKQSDGITVKAISKRASDFKVEKELASRVNSISAIESGLPLGYVLENNYIRDAILKLIAGVLILLVAIIGVTINKKGLLLSDTAGKCFVALAVAALVFALIAIL